MLPYNMQIDLRVSGEEAIVAVINNSYDLIFMDHMMPEMDGIETVAKIREMGAFEPHLATIPIIALTANAISGNRDIFMDHGFNDFLAKPIDTEMLNFVLEQWIPKEKQILSVINVVSASDKSLNDVVIEGLDINEGVILTGGSVNGYLNVLTIFCENGREKIDEIKKCLIYHNLPLFTTYVHALKSASASIGAVDLSVAADALEQAGLRGDADYVYEKTPEFLADLGSLLDKIRKMLAQREHDYNEEPEDMDELMENLSVLKTALDEYDIHTINEIIDNLHNFNSSPEYRESIGKILQAQLTGDYDEAAAAIEELLNEMKGK